MSRTPRTARPLAGFAIALSLALLAASPAVAQVGPDDAERPQDRPRTGDLAGYTAILDEHYPEAPEDLVADYLAAARKTTVFQVATALRMEAMAPLAETWGKALGLRIEPRPENLLDAMSRLRGLPELESVPYEGGAIHIGSVSYSLQHGFGMHGRGIPLIILKRVPDEGEARAYRVDRERLGELDFEVAIQLRVESLLYTRLERFSTADEPLADIVQMLCQQAGVEEYVLQADLARKVTILQESRNRSIKECLEAAARVAGLEVRYSGRRQPTGRMVHYTQVAEEVFKRRLERELKGEPPDTVDPTEVLRSLVDEAAEATGRVLVSLEPRQPVEEK